MPGRSPLLVLGTAHAGMSHLLAPLPATDHVARDGGRASAEPVYVEFIGFERASGAPFERAACQLAAQVPARWVEWDVLSGDHPARPDISIVNGEDLSWSAAAHQANTARGYRVVLAGETSPNIGLTVVPSVIDASDLASLLDAADVMPAAPTPDHGRLSEAPSRTPVRSLQPAPGRPDLRHQAASAGRVLALGFDVRDAGLLRRVASAEGIQPVFKTMAEARAVPLVAGAHDLILVHLTADAVENQWPVCLGVLQPLLQMQPRPLLVPVTSGSVMAHLCQHFDKLFPFYIPAPPDPQDLAVVFDFLKAHQAASLPGGVGRVAL